MRTREAARSRTAQWLVRLLGTHGTAAAPPVGAEVEAAAGKGEGAGGVRPAPHVSGSKRTSASVRWCVHVCVCVHARVWTCMCTTLDVCVYAGNIRTWQGKDAVLPPDAVLSPWASQAVAPKRRQPKPTTEQDAAFQLKDHAAFQLKGHMPISLATRFRETREGAQPLYRPCIASIPGHHEQG